MLPVLMTLAVTLYCGPQVDRMAGFTVEHGPYSVNEKGLLVERHFLPPGTLRCVHRHHNT